jgi:hypothetical protein
MTILTREQIVQRILDILESSVSDLPEDKREEAKAGVLNAWGASMFYSGGPTKEKNHD